MIEMRMRIPTPPGEMLRALAQQCSCARHIFHLMQISMDKSCYGVFGDADMGWYEWLIWIGGKLEISDCAYGSTDVALRDVLARLTERGEL